MSTGKIIESGFRILPIQILVVVLLFGLHLSGLVDALPALIIAAVVGIAFFWIDRRYRIVVNRLTDALKTARSARRNLAPLRAKIAEGIDAPLLLIDPLRKVLDANRPARTLFGNNLIGRDVSLYVRHPDILEALGKVMQGAPIARLEASLTGAVERIFSISVSRVDNSRHASDSDRESTEPAFYVVISMHDITKMRVAERMRADFVANASHELRTPLSSVIGFIETMNGPAKGDEAAQERFLGIMEEESRRMVRLIDDLLSLSRIELDKHVQPKSSVQLEPILKGVAASLEPTVQKRHMAINILVPDSLEPVQGDADQIHQMLQNLTSNALKYAYEGSTVTLSAQPVERIPESGQRGIAISITDHGPGIPPEHLPRLTERFYRVDAARSRKLGGTGLGLAIVKHIVSRHRGHLDIRSILGKGTTVTISLPIYQGLREPEDHP
ncbi:histidine kinase [Iodidimonas gelatinilytica]|uniref:histidine kinase n=2 Tax=Iodidimonas gelatinilytica TaxID=1236966 RepID=A0A5A7MYZ3_9PROT|nr:ATP-binding protein [Iodidimonas gelatinilytica]GER00199.1 histidine kinase [Iodidimonas gelatinilytica]